MKSQKLIQIVVFESEPWSDDEEININKARAITTITTTTKKKKGNTILLWTNVTEIPLHQLNATNPRPRSLPGSRKPKPFGLTPCFGIWR